MREAYNLVWSVLALLFRSRVSMAGSDCVCCAIVAAQPEPAPNPPLNISSKDFAWLGCRRNESTLAEDRPCLLWVLVVSKRLNRCRPRQPTQMVSQATIAAISGLMPTMFMTRVRL